MYNQNIKMNFLEFANIEFSNQFTESASNLFELVESVENDIGKDIVNFDLCEVEILLNSLNIRLRTVLENAC